MKHKRKHGSHTNNESWRQFEALVARIETALSPKGAVVKSPDFLPDKITKDLREVDASIAFTIGTTPVLIIIECRERRRVQDSLWIEQLATKQRHLGAAKCVAVSSTGFSKGALAKANALGIEVRRVDRMNPELIASLLPTKGFLYNFKLGKVDPSFCPFGKDPQLDTELDRRINRTLASKFTLDDPLLRSRNSDKVVSIRDYIVQVINAGYEGLSRQEKVKIKVDHEYAMSWVDVEPPYIDLGADRFDMFAVAFVVTFKQFVDYTLTPSEVFGYQDASRLLVSGVEFDVMANQQELSPRKLTLHFPSGSDAKVSFWPNPFKQK